MTDLNNNESNQYDNFNNKVSAVKQKGKWSTGKLIIGIISIVFFLIIGLQSCAVGIGNALSSSGEISGFFGFLVGLFMCIAGIVGITTRKSPKSSGSIATCIFYGVAAFLAYVGAGSYADLKIWGFISLAFGFVFLLSIMNTRKSKIISTIATAVFLILLVAIASSEDDASSASKKGDVDNNIVINDSNGHNDDSSDAGSDNANADASHGDNDAGSDDGISSEEDKGVESNDDKLETIEEQILLDQEGIKITAIEMVDDSIWGKGIKVLIDNNSDKSIGAGLDALIVNNYMITDLFATDVAPGKSSNETIYISSSELEQAGIENIGQVELYFRVYDSDSYEAEFEADVVTIHTSEYDNMDVDITVEGTELVNQDGIKIVGRYVDEDSFWGEWNFIIYRKFY